MAVNLWPNADLEDGITEWNKDASTTISDSTAQSNSGVDGGTHSLKIAMTGTAWQGAKTDFLSIDASTQYTMSTYIYPTSATTSIRVLVQDQGYGTLDSVTDTYTADTWTRVDVTFTTDVADTTLRLVVGQAATTETEDIYVDTVMLETGASASAWVNYVAGVEFTVGNVGAVAIAGYDPTILASTAFTVSNVGATAIAGYDPVVGIAAGTWEVGAYIYDTIGETHVNVGNAGAVGVTGFNPGTLSADTTFSVGNVGEVGIAGFGATVVLPTAIAVLNAGAVTIAGFAATVTNVAASVGDGITRIAMKMATIMRR